MMIYYNLLENKKQNENKENVQKIHSALLKVQDLHRAGAMVWWGDLIVTTGERSDAGLHRTTIRIKNVGPLPDGKREWPSWSI